jgi:hypothetical protein
MRMSRTALVASSANISVDRKSFAAERRTRRVAEKGTARPISQSLGGAGNRNEPLLVLEQNKKPPRVETWRLREI